MNQIKKALTNQLFWNYSLALYSCGKVMPTCLQLQDAYKLNVNLLLFCCYLDSLGYSLTSSELQTLIEAVKQTDPKIQLKRKERRAAKNTKPADVNYTKYEALKQEELVLEQHQQADIISCMLQLQQEKENTNVEIEASISAIVITPNSTSNQTQSSKDDKCNLQQYQQFAVTNTIPSVASITSLMAALNTANQTLLTKKSNAKDI